MASPSGVVLAGFGVQSMRVAGTGRGIDLSRVFGTFLTIGALV